MTEADRIGTDKGSGLGLSIVAAIAEAHGGTLDLRECRHESAGCRGLAVAGRRPGGGPAGPGHGRGRRSRLGVLESLLATSPAFLRAEDLLEQVWDEQADPFTNTVTVTIGRLRRKLGDPPVIATRPGIGYRICDQPA